eukprot:6913288-Alexandrium_andersonii.AAC.1
MRTGGPRCRQVSLSPYGACEARRLGAWHGIGRHLTYSGQRTQSPWAGILLPKNIAMQDYAVLGS